MPWKPIGPEFSLVFESDPVPFSGILHPDFPAAQIDVYCGTLPPIDPRYPLLWLEWCYLRRLQPIYGSRPWLIPFTSGPVNDRALCFDIRRPNSDGDYPVIRISNRFVDQVELRATFEQEFQVFESCYCYFDFLHRWLTSCKLGLGWENDPFPQWLAERNKNLYPPDTCWDE